jgi:hypothetical protein
MSSCSCHAPTRRHVFALGAVAAVFPSFSACATSELPREVAGVAIPSSPFVDRVAAFARKSQPEFLFNHSMRTFLFGSIMAKKLGLAVDPELAFAASSMHDVGLLPAFASEKGSFESDGADAGEKFVRANGATAIGGNDVWHAIVLHDWRWNVALRQGGDAAVVAAGAGSDVNGPDQDFDPKLTAEIVQAFPRLQFKTRFTALIEDHCRRKPKSQMRTWLEGVCREQNPGLFADTVIKEIAAAPFAE